MEGSMDDRILSEVAKKIKTSSKGVALTGAGISVESGIPDFRSKGGLWERFDPMEYAYIEAFERNPEKIWNMMGEMDKLMENARPNPAHYALAELEKMGHLIAVITQNVDNLHQDAGNTRVIEFHGNSRKLICLSCGNEYRREEALKISFPPRCKCGRILKPGVVFFGEPIPFEANQEALHLARNCDIMLVVGTSAVVAPASDLPVIAKRSGAIICEVNLEKTPLTDWITDYFLQGSASLVLQNLVNAVKNLG